MRVRAVSSRRLGVSGAFIGTSSGDVTRLRVATRRIPSPILPQLGFIAAGYERWLFRLRVVVMSSPRLGTRLDVHPSSRTAAVGRALGGRARRCCRSDGGGPIG